MLVVGGMIVIFFLSFIALFAFPALSPIPYFPSNKRDFTKIIQALQLKNDQQIIDLGAGDGAVIFEAASIAYQKNLNTKFIAIELNPVLILIMQLRRFFHINKKNISILRRDLFTFLPEKNDLATFFYLYVSPWFLEKIYVHLKKEIQQFHVVSYMYEVPRLKARQIIRGHHKIFVY